jgi:hypothetical protein
MFEKILNALEGIDQSTELELGQGHVLKINLDNELDNWTGWFKEKSDKLTPIYIFSNTNFNKFHFETSRMTLSFMDNINIKIKDASNVSISGLTLLGSNFSQEEFSIVAGTINSLLYDSNIEFKDLENLMLLLERAVGREKSISKESIVGFWGEILVIDFAKNTEKFILGWSKDSNSIHDFTFEDYPDLEIKTSIGNLRSHYISSDQVENQEKETIFISLHSREIDNGRFINDIFKRINKKIDLANDTNTASKLKKIFLDKCLDRVGDSLYLSKFTADEKFALDNIKAFFANELGIPNISNPVIKAKYKVLLQENETRNSNLILKTISDIFI